MNLKGSLSLLILYVLRDGPLHGYRIAKSIKQKSSDVLDFGEGTLYPALHALEKQGCIISSEGLENGRVRRYYQITERGLGILREELDEWNLYSHAVNQVLGLPEKS